MARSYQMYGVMVPLFLLSSLANAQYKNGSYYCVVEWIGGGWYDARTKHWEGSKFNPNSDSDVSKFILKVTFNGRHTEQVKEPLGDIKQEQFDDYNVTIKGSDSSIPLDCRAGFDKGLVWYNRSKVISTRSGYNILRCNIVYDYVFNLNTNRFLQISTNGFISRRDNNEDTPSINGGTCTKID
jgi:hypothetical protein